MYPGLSAESPHTGVFIKEQVASLEKLGVSFRLVKIQGKRGYRRYLSYLNSIISINFLLLTKRDFDIIHIHYGLSGLFLLFNFTFPKSRVVLTLHGSDIAGTSRKYMQRFISKRVARRAGSIVLVNERDAMEVQSAKSRKYILPCGVDTDFFRPQSQARRSRQIVFPAARHRPEKNFELFQDVFRILQRTIGELEYVCLDGMNRSEVRDTLCQSGLLLMTSTSEGSPQVVKEGLACNIPIVSVNVGDVEKLLDGVPHGFIAEEYNAQELAALCIKALNVQQPAAGGPERLAELEMDSPSVARKLLEIYNAARGERQVN